MQIQNALQEQYDVILDRKTSNGGEKSYTELSIPGGFE